MLMSQNIQFKGFSPLRTPDVLKFVKQRHKKRHEKYLSEHVQGETSEVDGEVNEDLLKIACKVSNKLSHKKDRFKFRSSDLPVDIDISPTRQKLLDARLLGKTHQENSTFQDSEMTVGQIEIPKVTMQQKSPKKQHKRTAHSMSDSEPEVGNNQEMSFNENDDMHDSPSLLSGLNNTLDKSSPKKKHKSHKKHKKRKHNESNNDSQDISASVTEEDRIEKNDDNDSSSQKVLNRSSPQKQADKSPRKQKTSGAKNHHNVNQTVSDEEADGSGDNAMAEPVSKYKVPENFIYSSHPTQSLLDAEVVQGKELWLIKAPSDFDMSKLTGQDISLEEASQIQNEDVVVDTLPVPGDIRGVSYCPILPSKKSEKMIVGAHFCGQVHVNSSVEIPTLPKVKAPPPKHIATPGNLRPRYVPFGADISACRLQKSEVKHKKTKKRKHSVDETDDAPVHHKKKKKKNKH